MTSVKPLIIAVFLSVCCEAYVEYQDLEDDTNEEADFDDHYDGEDIEIVVSTVMTTLDGTDVVHNRIRRFGGLSSGARTLSLDEIQDVRGALKQLLAGHQLDMLTTTEVGATTNTDTSTFEIASKDYFNGARATKTADIIERTKFYEDLIEEILDRAKKQGNLLTQLKTEPSVTRTHPREITIIREILTRNENDQGLTVITTILPKRTQNLRNQNEGGSNPPKLPGRTMFSYRNKNDFPAWVHNFQKSIPSTPDRTPIHETTKLSSQTENKVETEFLNVDDDIRTGLIEKKNDNEDKLDEVLITEAIFKGHMRQGTDSVIDTSNDEVSLSSSEADNNVESTSNGSREQFTGTSNAVEDDTRATTSNSSKQNEPMEGGDITTSNSSKEIGTETNNSADSDIPTKSSLSKNETASSDSASDNIETTTASSTEEDDFEDDYDFDMDQFKTPSTTATTTTKRSTLKLADPHYYPYPYLSKLYPSTISTNATTVWRTRRRKTTTAITTTTEGPQINIPALVALMANLSSDFETNLTEVFNETLQKYNIPTCPTLEIDEPPIFYDLVNAPVVSKCFVCGLHDGGIPEDSYCGDAFATDFLPLVPIDPQARANLVRFRKYCRYLDVNNFYENETEPRSIYGRFTGGCSVRWIDLSGVYTQRACRNKRHAMTGKHFASKRMAKLEMALNDVENGCIISPMATLVPMSRGISLYARFHACVCTGSWCNEAVENQPWISNIAMMVCWTITTYF